MKWYTIDQCHNEWVVYRNVQLGNGMAWRGIFRGTRTECIKWCEENQIKVGYNHRRKIKK